MKIKKIVEVEIQESETLAHLYLLASAFFENMEYDGSCEFGSIGIDCKRPFGNSSVEMDVLEIVGLIDDYDDFYKLPDEAQEEYTKYASYLYCERLVPYLKEWWRKTNDL